MANYFKISKKRPGPHKRPSQATRGPRVWDPWTTLCCFKNVIFWYHDGIQENISSVETEQLYFCRVLRFIQ